MSYVSTLTRGSGPLPPPRVPGTAQPIAHVFHTIALFLILILFTLFGHARSHPSVLQATSRLMRYTTSILLEWLLLGAVVAGIYQRRAFFTTAFRSSADSSLKTLALGVVVYLFGFVAVIATGAALSLTPLAQKRNEALILAMLPRTPLEFLLWFGVSLTAGICEELIFRGYLLQQLDAWTNRPIVSIILAALLFGCVHLYEGLGAILPLAALAIVYGLVVRRFRGDLRAVIVAHTLQDFVVALLLLARPILERYASKG